MAAQVGGKRRRRGRRGRPQGWEAVVSLGVEVLGLATAALLVVIAVLGRAAGAFAGGGLFANLLPFAVVVLALGIAAAALLRGWLYLRAFLFRHSRTLPAALALIAGVAGLALATRATFQRDLAGLRLLVGGPGEAQKLTIAHQVYATYRRADLAGLQRILERSRVYEPTVLEAAGAFGVDAEVLMGVGAAESAFYPRDSTDGGRGLFQITAPPPAAVAEVRKVLHVDQLDPLNQRHNAFLAAATLHEYLGQMHGDPFLGLLAYNIGPRNGGLRAAMEQYGAHDFVTVQPYLQNLPRDYPIRVLSAALAYRLWRTQGTLPRYEDGDNAVRIQRVGIPGLTVARS
jgi:hypothetical protein